MIHGRPGAGSMASFVVVGGFKPQKLLYLEQPLLKLAAFSFSTSCFLHLDYKWRTERKLPANPNTSGILTDKSDYSYLDGRPAEIGIGVKRRLEKQKEYAKKIVTLSKEMDFAVNRYKALEQQKLEEQQRLLNNKLKRKGHLLLQPK
jgi:large subunit ribosomal protein L52